MTDEIRQFCFAAANAVAFLAGARAVDVWPSFGKFEEDMCTLADAIGYLEDNAKAILEERARRLRSGHQGET